MTQYFGSALSFFRSSSTASASLSSRSDVWRRLFISLSVVCSLGALSACETAYYATMERFGFHKRDILVDSITEARDAQTEAKDQFSSALERFRSELGSPEGELSEKYDALNAEYKSSLSRANQVKDRIKSVEDVAEALFKEWANELEEYTNANLRRSSQKQWRDTRANYEGMLRAMHQAENRMDPVLQTFKDQVLFLKHNLNAQAIGSLKAEFSGLDASIQRLITEMNTSIAEADKFIQVLEKGQ